MRNIARSPLRKIRRDSLRFDLPQQPLQSRGMLLVVTAKIMNESGHRDGTVSLERCLALKLFGRELLDKRHRVRARDAERSERGHRIGLAVSAISRECIGVDRS